MSPKNKAATTASANKKTILLVDDDPSVREMVGRVLIGEGYLVLSAANGPEALRIAATSDIDLVLLDLNMPGQSGWDTFERLTSGNPLLAVMIITARSQQLFTAVNAGVGALLEKPLNFPKLLKTMRDLLAEPPDTGWPGWRESRSISITCQGHDESANVWGEHPIAVSIQFSAQVSNNERNVPYEDPSIHLDRHGNLVVRAIRCEGSGRCGFPIQCGDKPGFKLAARV